MARCTGEENNVEMADSNRLTIPVVKVLIKNICLQRLYFCARVCFSNNLKNYIKTIAYNV